MVEEWRVHSVDKVGNDQANFAVDFSRVGGQLGPLMLGGHSGKFRVLCITHAQKHASFRDEEFDVNEVGQRL